MEKNGKTMIIEFMGGKPTLTTKIQDEQGGLFITHKSLNEDEITAALTLINQENGYESSK